MFVTFFAGIINLNTGVMEFCNAGHNYPYIVQPDGRLQQLRIRNGIPMGIFSDTVYTRDQYRFNPQEALILVTDGITEAQNVSDDFFGEDNLASTLVRLAGRNTREMTELLIVELKRFAEGAEQSDDITILSLRYTGRRE
jgi:sigma-B regulation protein RsbU (phosphoserine phosphatase)